MMTKRFIAIVGSIVLVGFACALGSCPARAGSTSYTVTVDTTGLSGGAGYLEAELAASSPPGSASVAATISNLSSNVTPGAVTYDAGDVTGLFSSTPLVLANDNAGSSVPGLSDLQQAITYGTFLSFTLTLSGSEVNGGSSVPFTGTVSPFPGRCEPKRAQSGSDCRRSH